VHGYLDRIAVSDITRFERGLVSELEANGQDILKAIGQTGEISADTDTNLKSLLDGYTQAFA
jgi:F-type H+/Na+-transporting ATPase subunit alpha